MLEFIPSRQVSQRLSEGWKIFSYNEGDYAAVMYAPPGWLPRLLRASKKPRLCSIEDCGGVHYAHNLCRKHYKRVRDNGTTGLTTPRTCGVVDCGDKHHGNGLCEKHWKRLWRAERRWKSFECAEAA